MGLRDVFHRMPETKRELSDYIQQNYNHVKELVQKNPQYKTVLESAIEESFDKYTKHLGGTVDKLSGVGHAIGYAADAYLLRTGDVVGNLGGKFFAVLAQIPEKAYSLAYAAQTGNYLDAAQSILEGALSYLPGLTFVDQGLTRIVQKRMVRDAVMRFEKELGIYTPWTMKLSEKLKEQYTAVKDRAGNVFSPWYQGLSAT